MHARRGALSSVDVSAYRVEKNDLPERGFGRSYSFRMLLLLLVTLDIEELTDIDYHPAPTLNRWEMSIPLFNPVLCQYKLSALGL